MRSLTKQISHFYAEVTIKNDTAFMTKRAQTKVWVISFAINCNRNCTLLCFMGTFMIYFPSTGYYKAAWRRLCSWPDKQESRAVFILSSCRTNTYTYAQFENLVCSLSLPAKGSPSSTPLFEHRCGSFQTSSAPLFEWRESIAKCLLPFSRLCIMHPQ